jgi:DNA-binding NarL/FixJ family response regulator
MSPLVLVADPLPIFRSGVRSVLAREPEFEVAEAASLDELVARATPLNPDVVLVDVALPPEGGLAAVRCLAASFRGRLVVWGLECGDDHAVDAIFAGASGFLPKELEPEGFVRSLRGLARGEAPLPRGLVAAMIEALHAVDARERARQTAERLSYRERQVLGLVASGARNRQIAEALAISEFTVKRHVQNILHKLDVGSRSAAAAFHRTAFGEQTAEAAQGTA